MKTNSLKTSSLTEGNIFFSSHIVAVVVVVVVIVVGAVVVVVVVLRRVNELHPFQDGRGVRSVTRVPIDVFPLFQKEFHMFYMDRPSHQV